MRTLKDKVIEEKVGRSSFKYVSFSLVQWIPSDVFHSTGLLLSTLSIAQ